MLSELLISCTSTRQAAVLLHLTKPDTTREGKDAGKERKQQTHCCGERIADARKLLRRALQHPRMRPGRSPCRRADILTAHLPVYQNQQLQAAPCALSTGSAEHIQAFCNNLSASHQCHGFLLFALYECARTHIFFSFRAHLM